VKPGNDVSAPVAIRAPLSERGRPASAPGGITRDQRTYMAAPVRTAVVSGAGRAPPLLRARKAMPKEMLTVVDRPLIQHVVDEAREAGIEHFIFVTGRNKGVIEDHFDRQFELETTLTEKRRYNDLQVLAGDLPEPGQMSFTRQQS